MLRRDGVADAANEVTGVRISNQTLFLYNLLFKMPGPETQPQLPFAKGRFKLCGAATSDIIARHALNDKRSARGGIPRARRWHHIETLYTANTAGNADGTVKLWLDGKLLIDYANRVQWTADGPRQWEWTTWTPSMAVVGKSQ